MNHREDKRTLHTESTYSTQRKVRSFTISTSLNSCVGRTAPFSINAFFNVMRHLHAAKRLSVQTATTRLSYS
ncbi:hypothetical protein D7S44_21470 [Pantoea piersonii]|nr:hypothetical protein D7S44_21470 [Pantoea piersonii]